MVLVVSSVREDHGSRVKSGSDRVNVLLSEPLHFKDSEVFLLMLQAAGFC